MATYTLSCADEDCSWQEDLELTNRNDAEAEASIRACPLCGSDLIVLDS